MNRSADRLLSELKEQVARAVDSLPVAEPPFNLQIQWSVDYDDLFAKKGEITSEDQTLVRAFMRGRCIIVGRGGGGKTRMLYRLMRAALSDGIVPVFVDLKKWTGSDYSNWRDWISSDIGTGASFLLERFAIPETDSLTLDALPPETTKLLIVDGLNEITASVGQQILLALDEFARDQVGMSILVADRLSRRELPSPNRWALGAVQAISTEEIARFVDITGRSAADVEALGTPYFLGAAIRKESFSSSRAETLHEYFLHHGKLSAEDTSLVAEAAFDAYAATRTRTFPRAQFAQKVGETLVNRLIDGGLLSKADGEDIHFLHHLLHDYLAAKFVSSMPENAWSGEVLQTISFGSSSFDTISMVFSLLATGRADQFLRRVYDWNPYAAAYALADSISATAAPSKEMQVVIFAMLAEKVFDIVEPTSQRASDALALIATPEAAAFLNCDSFDALLNLVRDVKSDVVWFQDWQKVFTLARTEAISPADLEQIGAADSVIGWTVANVGKRVLLTADQQARLRELAPTSSTTTKWRIAHVLGAWPSNENAKVLAALLSTANEESVRYGALRSLIEVAARGDADLQEGVCRTLKEHAQDIARNAKLVEELRRAMWIQPSVAPEKWLSIVRQISLLLYEFDEDLEARDAWQLYVERSGIRYRKRNGDTLR
jgi:type III secretion system FlhB-like substrate exporter